jgi:hypothetical protein
VLCPSLASFRFSAEGTIDLGITDPIDDEEPIRPSAGIEGGYDGGEEMDVFAGVDFGGGGDDDEGGGAVDFFDDGPGDEGGVESGQVEDFDPRRPQGERDLVVSMDDKGDQSFDFFDASSTKNWAGPDHWKMRRPMNLRKGSSQLLPLSVDTDTNGDRRECDHGETAQGESRLLYRLQSPPSHLPEGAICCGPCDLDQRPSQVHRRSDRQESSKQSASGGEGGYACTPG